MDPSELLNTSLNLQVWIPAEAALANIKVNKPTVNAVTLRISG
jgi:hypothetical protein